jgi:hypothetical protein
MDARSALRAAAGLASAGALTLSLCSCGSGGTPKAAAPTSTGASTTTAAGGTTTGSSTLPAATTTTSAAPNAPVCPLTGTPAPKTGIPQRAALAVKVENLPQARPQYGLDYADDVFEEPVEGGITRFVALYQCRDASRIEPVRSGRLVDPDILRPLGKMLFAYSGAIQPVITKVDVQSPLQDVGANWAPDAYQRDPDRSSPHNLQTSTSALYAAGIAHHDTTTPPPALFTYGPTPAGATPAGAVHIPYEYSPVTWTWDPATNVWLRSYSDTGKALQGDGTQLSATNVVVLHVVEYPTQYVEDVNGVHENELVLTGSGPAQVYRNGAELNGSWHRPSLTDFTTFTETDGTPITLAPGVTWIELVPTSLTVTTQP